MIDYGNEKLNQIFRDTWPNLGWARRETMSKSDKFAGNYEGPLYAPHPDLTKHSEYYYDYDRNDPNRQNPFMTHNLPEKDDAPWLNTQYDGFMTHEEMLEEAAKREAANEAIIAKVSEEDYRKVQEEIANKKALEELDKLYDENGDALQQLAAIERQELIEKLEAKKKENFQLVADACMIEYSKNYDRDVFPVDEHWVYMVSEYFGTGEGQTVCVMMTQATPYGDDFSGENKYVPVNSKEYRAVRAFHEQFGTWHLHGLRFLNKQDFFSEYSYYIPPAMMKLSNKSCYKDFYTRVHYNFS